MHLAGLGKPAILVNLFWRGLQGTGDIDSSYYCLPRFQTMLLLMRE